MDKKLKQQQDSSSTMDKQAFGIKQIENTPICILSSDKGHFGVIGKHRVTEIHETYESCLSYCEGVPTWAMITALVETIIENKKLKENE